MDSELIEFTLIEGFVSRYDNIQVITSFWWCMRVYVRLFLDDIKLEYIYASGRICVCVSACSCVCVRKDQCLIRWWRRWQPNAPQTSHSRKTLCEEHHVHSVLVLAWYYCMYWRMFAEQRRTIYVKAQHGRVMCARRILLARSDDMNMIYSNPQHNLWNGTLVDWCVWVGVCGCARICDSMNVLCLY